jgi:hypothetical protein
MMPIEIHQEIERELSRTTWTKLIENHEFLYNNKDLFEEKPKLIEITPTQLGEYLFFEM